MSALEREFYNKEELAEILQLNPMTIYRMARRGDLPFHMLGRAMRFRRNDIEDFLEKHRNIGMKEDEKE